LSTGSLALANPKTLSPFLAYFLLISAYYYLMSSSIATFSPFLKIVVAFSQILSGAPLMKIE
jgi:hypothetical protein